MHRSLLWSLGLCVAVFYKQAAPIGANFKKLLNDR